MTYNVFGGTLNPTLQLLLMTGRSTNLPYTPLPFTDDDDDDDDNIMLCCGELVLDV